VRIANVDEIRSQGVELNADVKIVEDVSFTINYTFTDAEVVEGPEKGNAVEGTPKHAAAVSILYRAPFDVIVNPRWRYIGDTFQDISNEAPQDAHSIYDLFVSWRARKNVELFVIGENIFDAQYISDGFGGDLGAPRQVSGGVRASF